MSFNKEELLAKTNEISKNTLMETLQIEIVDFGVESLTARMPVNRRVHQPEGVLHGGATAALTESVGSFASHIFMDMREVFVRGIEINVNHIKSVSEGYVYAKATFIHKGRTTQLLDVRVTDEKDNLIAVSKVTTIALPRKK